MTQFIELCTQGNLEKIKDHTREFLGQLTRENIMSYLSDPTFPFHFQVSYETDLYKGSMNACRNGHMNVIEWIHDVFWMIHDLVVDWSIDQKKLGYNKNIEPFLPKSFLFQDMLEIALKNGYDEIAEKIFGYEVI
jgi:hypothetical protein